MSGLWGRRAANGVMAGLCALMATVAVLPLLLVLYYVTRQGLSALDAAFFTRLPAPMGEKGGGMGNAILGSVELVGLASLIGLPIGLLGGIYLAEFGHRRLPTIVRFAADVLNGIPSIVFGVVAYTLLVVPMRGFSPIAGGFALALILIPIVLRTTEEMIRLVPVSLRDASLALGVPHYRTVLSAVIPAARSGIITGVILATARIAGETAPLLFTALNNQGWSFNLRSSIASLPVQIYTYATQPYDEAHRLAWGGALVLIALVTLLSIATRWVTRPRHGIMGRGR
jgi:phosphate transport system permease protein